MQMEKQQAVPGLWKLRLSGMAHGTLRQVAVLLLGIAAGHARLYGMIAPFGLALALGAAEDDALPAAAGAAIGTFLLGTNNEVLPVLCALAALTAVRRVQKGQFRPAAIAVCAGLIGMQGLLTASGAAGPQGLITASVSLAPAVAVGWWMRQKPVEEGSIGWLAPAMMLAAALAGWQAGPVCPGAVFAAGAAMAMACRGRREQALLAAAALGIGMAAANPALTACAIALLGGTALAVTYGAGLRLRCAVWFALGALPGLFCAADTEAMLVITAAIGLGAVAFWLMPVRLVLAVPAAEPTECAGRPAVSTAATRLSSVAESLSGIAKTVNGVYTALPHKGETYNWVTERTHEMLCAHCARRETCWQDGYSDTIDGMFHLKPLLERNGRVDVPDLPGTFARCIHPTALCAAVSQAWTQYSGRRQTRVQADALRSALTEQYDAVADALTGLSSELSRPGIRDEYKSGRVAALFASLGSEPAECAVTLDRDGRAHAAVTLPRRRYSEAELAALTGEVSRICHRPMNVPEKLSCKEATTLLFCEKPTMHPIFGTAGCAAMGEVSGDAVQQFCTGDCAVSILCDGMGTGRPAAVDGNLAATLTARLLRAGFEPETAARLINVALNLKSEEESGATLDLMRIDLFTGATELFKAGGAPGFVVQAGRARKIDGPGLPMGILSSVNAQVRHIHLEAGDFAVLVSDGMLVDGPDWILQQLELSAKSGQTAQQLAQLLVKTARSRAEHTGRPDDITAAVVALEKSV